MKTPANRILEALVFGEPSPVSVNILPPPVRDPSTINDHDFSTSLEVR